MVFFRSFKVRLARPTPSVLFAFWLWIALFSSFASCVWCVPSYGQAQNGGTISGRVIDPSGAAIPHASLLLRSTTNGRETKATSNGSGEYIFNAVPVDTYTLSVSATTFSDYIVSDVSVDAGGSLTLDAKLNPGSASISVTVAAPGANVDTQSASIAAVIDPKLVENLPLDGNNVVETAALLPGVTNVNAPATFTSDTGGPTYNVSGSRANQNLLLLDGALWNNLYANTGLNFPPRQVLQEVSVILNNYKAQYGRNVGSVFNVLTRSGTNSFHGELWEFAQNKIFNASDYLSHLNPHLVSNQFGASLTGPIIRDRLTFAVGVQDLRVATVAFAQAPTLDPAERGLMPDGVTPRPCITPAYLTFSSCALEDQGGGTSLKNPVAAGQTAMQAAWLAAGNTGTSPCVTFLNFQPSTLPQTVTGSNLYEVPSVCFNPVSVALLSTESLPNAIIGGVPTAVTTGLQPRNDWDGFARVDWNLKRHTIAARFYKTAVDDRTANGVSAGVGLANYEIDANSGGITSGILDDNWVINPNLLNTARVAYKRYVYNIDPGDTRTIQSFGSNFAQPGHPALPRYFISGRFGAGTATNNYSRSVNEDIEGDDSLIWTHGVHNVQVGVELLRLQYLHRFDTEPSFNFNNTFTNIPSADYLFGLISTQSVGNGTNQAAIQHDVYLYAQDDWRILPHVTINFGVRYEIPFQWYQPDGQAATFIPGYQSSVYPLAPPNLAFVGDPGVKRSLVGTDFGNVAPRFGIAVDLRGNGRTVLRAGGGIFFDAINALVVGVTEPYHYAANYSNPPGGISQPLLGFNAIPQNYVKGQPAQFTTPYAITYPDQNFITPYTEAFNVGFQQVIGPSTLEINYVGRLGRHLALGYDYNPAIYDCSGTYFQLNPANYCTFANTGSDPTVVGSYPNRVRYNNFNYGGGGVLDYQSIGSSSYSAGQVIYRVRAQRGLVMLASYTYSKSMDDSSNGTSIGNSTDRATVSIHNAVSDFDARHILNLGFTLTPPKLTSSTRFVRGVLNNWVLSGIYTARTGNPISCTIGGDASLRYEPREYCEFPAGGYVPLPSTRHRQAKVAEWINVADVSVPANGTYGNAPRNFFVGPAFILPTFSLRRDFPFGTSGRDLQLRVDVIGAFNTPNLGQPNITSLSGIAAKNVTGDFGGIQATAGNNAVAGTNGRRLQLSGSYRF